MNEIITTKRPLLGLTLDQLTQEVIALGMPRFTGKQIAQWLYHKRATTIDEMSNISKANRALLAEHFEVGRSQPVTSQLSIDGTRKYLFRVSNGGLVESVFIPEGDRATLCISSQVGCKMNCLFCMTGKQGFKAHLSVGEIINQVLSVEESERLTNIVYMGMGEPLDNPDNVLSSIEVMTAEWGLGWSPKRLTLSTVGVRRGLERFLRETKCHLAVSLHNPFAEGRLQIMPAERGTSLEETLEMIRQVDFSGQRRVSFEYIVFDGVNDSPAHAAELARILRGIPCRINLIPFHQIPNVPLRPVSAERMEAFKALLEQRGYVTTIRTSRGEDISAACGMLSTKEQMNL
ncbi:23S rRNA (adenine(2503)-C(2))-methyltransferase RlmN [Porphyromonas sp. COT-239 OH1446]|uniref:23S rRNA (adenine(2503)-C(2))-methyltransferase RlmN n=1 Tax=Porphyromonas sp. COT-239 OH1446 TaxID=1515613 RepID=UPI00052B6A98|nr:23S rRNA (adenine(2503)-C(2))-methyltransferase RlmN [Porphyromonas sp. COT-239 OH1446]KGN68382.1 ribosomal RNA large subunit methyltransferase N [Porphyromonas sp. COT-239 OH1446]